MPHYGRSRLVAVVTNNKNKTYVITSKSSSDPAVEDRYEDYLVSKGDNTTSAEYTYHDNGDRKNYNDDHDGGDNSAAL